MDVCSQRLQAGPGFPSIPIPTPIQTMIGLIGNHCLKDRAFSDDLCGRLSGSGWEGRVGKAATLHSRCDWGEVVEAAGLEFAREIPFVGQGDGEAVLAELFSHAEELAKGVADR